MIYCHDFLYLVSLLWTNIPAKIIKIPKILITKYCMKVMTLMLTGKGNIPCQIVYIIAPPLTAKTLDK